MYKILFSFFIAGLSFGAGPCLVSCGPLILTYIIGTNKQVKKSIWSYVLFSFSRVFVYVILSLALFLFGQAVLTSRIVYLSGYLLISGGVFVIITGFTIIFGKKFHSVLCRKLEGIVAGKESKNIVLFGVLIGVSPCVALVSVFTTIGLISKSWADSFVYALSFGLGTVVSPLFLLVIFAAIISKITLSNLIVTRIINIISGSVMVFLGSELIKRGIFNV